MAMQEHRSEGKHQIVVRMPVSLHARLVEHVSETDLPSVNQAVCDVVEQHLDRVDKRRLKAAA